MKKCFYFALMAALALANVSCDSDDDDDKGSSTDTSQLGNQQTGKYEEEVAHYTMSDTEAPVAEPIEVSPGSVVSLKGYNITQNGDIVFETEISNTETNEKLTKFCTYEVEVNKGDDKNIYTIFENIIDETTGKTTGKKEKVGTIEMTKTRADVVLVFNLEISVEIGGEMVPVTFASTAQAQQIVEATVDQLTSQLSNSWEIESMTLNLDFDKKTDVTTSSKSGSLLPFLELAEDNNVTLSDKEKENLKRSISSLIIEKNNLFVLKYSDGRSDAASWSWKDKSNGNLAIAILLQGDSNGNKFFNDDSKIAVQLRAGNKVSLALTTRLKDDECTASLIVNLK